MNVIFSPSVNNRFTEQYYHTCPMCAGISAKTLASESRPSLCSHHEHEYRKFLFEKYEKQEEEYLDRQEEMEYLKILYTLKKNRKEQHNENVS